MAFEAEKGKLDSIAADSCLAQRISSVVILFAAFRGHDLASIACQISKGEVKASVVALLRVRFKPSDELLMYVRHTRRSPGRSGR